MGRYNDNAPIGNTCPIINDVVRYIEVFREQYDTDQADYDFEMALGVLEDVRGANLELRNWGNDLYGQLEESEKERERFVIYIEDLEEKLMRADSRIEELEEYVEELRSKIAF